MRLLDTIQAHEFHVEDIRISLTISVRINIWPNHGVTSEQVLDAASKAENEAKDKGKNCLVFAR